MKSKSLFDHIKQITNVQNTLYWDSLEDGDKKTWSNYMVHRFLSMKSDWIQVVNELQKYWELAPKSVYQFYIDVLPKGRTFLKYTKSKKKSKEDRASWFENHVIVMTCDDDKEKEEKLKQALRLVWQQDTVEVKHVRSEILSN